MSIQYRKPLFDPAHPPQGTKLWLGIYAAQLGITVTDMAEAAQISRTAIADLLNNKWPVRTPAADIRARLMELFDSRGCSDEQLQLMFCAHLNGRHPIDDYLDPQAPRIKQPGVRTDRRPSPPTEEEEHMLPAKQTLTRAARQHFEIFRNPFDSELFEDDEIFINPDFAYVKEACLQAAFNASFVAVVGQSGAGKTTLVEHVEECIERDNRPIVVIRPSVLGMEERESLGTPIRAADILSAIVTTLKPGETPKQTVQARSTQAIALLTANAEAGQKHLLLIEEAHSMSDATLKHLKRLHEAKKVGRRPLLGILLVGQTELKHRLRTGYAPLREVVQRCEVVELLPLDNDLKAYLAHRAAQAGVKDLQRLVDDGGIEALRVRLREDMGQAGGKRRQASQLYPLAVNNLMTAALNAAAEVGAPVVNADVVRSL